MNIILLSGGSGTRLWPLSNDVRSKQFVRILAAPDGTMESMVQRVVRQLDEAGIGDNITVATSESQRDIITGQLGSGITVVAEPERRDTFPAIALACGWLKYGKACSDDEPVVVMPCDPYTDAGYFDTIVRMSTAVRDGVADLVLMGISPTYPSSKYGYVVPASLSEKHHEEVMPVDRFTEKPDVGTAGQLISEGALWNGGVFAFRLGYMMEIVRRYVPATSFHELRSRYPELPKISFDYEVAEKADSVAVVRFAGKWKDLGTWNSLTDELTSLSIGNVVMDGTSENTHVINELDVPVLCVGTHDLVVAVSQDGILVCEKSKCENIRQLAAEMKLRQTKMKL